MANITQEEKDIYNAYLVVTRRSQGKPYRKRENFDGFDESNNYVYIKKLSLFFSRYTHVDIEDFFKAPFEVYPTRDDTYDLSFYASRKALKIYTLYQTKKEEEPPDSTNQLYFIKNSLNFILKFCRNNKITLNNYIYHKTEEQYSFILHLKERKISFYVLFGFVEAINIIKTIDKNILEFMFKDIYNKLEIYRKKYNNSTKAKFLVVKGLEKIQDSLTTESN